MKDWLEIYTPEKLSYDALRLKLKEAWEQVDEDFLLRLIESMPARIQRVIEAQGGHTRY